MLSQTATSNGATAQEPAPTGKKPKKGKSKRKPLIITVVALVAVVGAYKFVLHKPHKVTKAVPGNVVNLPQTTLNLSSGQLLQVSVAVQLQAGVGGKKGGIPAGEVAQMENDEITSLSSFSASELSTSSGKARARQALLDAFRSVVGPGPVGPGVMAVYFTDFVMQ
jgi:flagellar basal body-associated protein FliL